MRILQIVVAPKPPPGAEPGVGGPERRAANLVDQWTEFDIEPTICYPRRGRLWQRFTDAGVPLVDFEIGSKGDFGAIRRIAEIARKYGARLIHTQGPASLDLLAGLASRRAGIPFVMTRPVMLEDERNRSALRMEIYRRIDALVTLRLPARIVAVSAAGLEHLEHVCRVPRSRLILIHNGIDLSRFVPAPLSDNTGEPGQAPVRLGMVAQLTPPKGWRDFIAVIGRLHAQGANVQGLIVGEGELRAELEAHVAQQGLGQVIAFTGFRADVAPVLATFDALLFTSHREGLSVAILEAMASGLPIIATNVGGTREQVITGENGFLSEPGDIDYLTRCALDLVRDPTSRRRMGNASRALAERAFSERRMLEQYAECYQSVATGEDRK